MAGKFPSVINLIPRDIFTNGKETRGTLTTTVRRGTRSRGKGWLNSE